MEVPLYSVVSGGGGLDHAIYNARLLRVPSVWQSMSSHRVVDYAGQPSSLY